MFSSYFPCIRFLFFLYFSYVSDIFRDPVFAPECPCQLLASVQPAAAMWHLPGRSTPERMNKGRGGLPLYPPLQDPD